MFALCMSSTGLHPHDTFDYRKLYGYDNVFFKDLGLLYQIQKISFFIHFSDKSDADAKEKFNIS